MGMFDLEDMQRRDTLEQNEFDIRRSGAFHQISHCKQLKQSLAKPLGIHAETRYTR